MNAKWITPSVTVLNKEGRVDLEENSKTYSNLIKNGIDGILILGSIGEFFALPLEEKKVLVKNAIKAVNGEVPIIVGTNSMILEECIEFSNFAIEQGAYGVIVIPPYYFSLPDSYVEYFYDQIAEKVNGKIYMYNFPAITGYDLKPELMLRLALKHKNIVGVKDTLTNMDHTRKIIKMIKPERPEFEVYSGFDENFAHNVLSGGNGCMAGISNFAPEIASGFSEAARKDNLTEMIKYQQQIDSLMSIYSIGGQFVPVIKRAMVERGIIKSAVCTPPIQALKEVEAEEIRRLLDKNSLSMI
jgi:dihydrodipicolinate synthase/N-acetylneuraminate lyase